MSTFSEGRFDRFRCTAAERGETYYIFCFYSKISLGFVFPPSDNYVERERDRKVQDGEEEDVQEEVSLCWTQTRKYQVNFFVHLILLVLRVDKRHKLVQQQGGASGSR